MKPIWLQYHSPMVRRTLPHANHNRPNYMKGHLNSHPVNRIFVDAGAVVNLLPYKTFARLHPHPAQLEEAQGLRLQSKF